MKVSIIFLLSAICIGFSSAFDDCPECQKSSEIEDDNQINENKLMSPIELIKIRPVRNILPPRPVTCPPGYVLAKNGRCKRIRLLGNINFTSKII